MSTAAAELVAPPNVTAQMSSLFNYLNGLEEFEGTILSLLRFASEDEIKQTRNYALAMGSTGWRLVCACDALLLSVDPAKPGVVDLNGTGRMAAAKERAKELGCEPWTIRRNAQIFNTFFKDDLLLNVQQQLEEKGYFEAALRARHPKKALRAIAKEKEKSASFTVRDAFRLVKETKVSGSSLGLSSSVDYLDPNFKNFLLELETSLTSYKNRCTRPEFAARIETMIKVTKHERERTESSDYESVRQQIDEGCCTAEEIAEEVYLSNAEVKAIFNKIIEKEPDAYEWRAIGANTEMARGSRSHGLFRKDAPAGDDFEMPGGRYEPTIEYDEGDD